MKVTAEMQALADALLKAEQAAKDAEGTEDTGTSNLDSPTIRLPRWSRAKLDKVRELSGIEIGDRLNSLMWKGYRFVGTSTNGQASMRERMARAAYLSLKEDGYDVSFYQQMD